MLRKHIQLVSAVVLVFGLITITVLYRCNTIVSTGTSKSLTNKNNGDTHQGGGEQVIYNTPNYPDQAAVTEAIEHAIRPLVANIAQIERRLDLLASLATPQQHLNPTTKNQLDQLAVRLDEKLTTNMKALQQTPVIISEFENEIGQSDWGEAMEESITWAHANADFFNEHGGFIDLECRQSRCSIGWTLPDDSSYTQDELDRLLTIGRYELMAVAAAGNSTIGQMQWRSQNDNSTEHIELYFTRK